MKNSLRVGITGGIGAGKSIVCKIFQTLAIPTYDADSRAKWLMNHSPSLKQQIIALFGEAAYEGGELNRSLLAKKAFTDPDLLKQLNQLVHPEVGKDYHAWQKAQKAPYSLKEAALLFESGSYKDLDLIITVTAPESLRISRVLKRDAHRSRKDIEDIINKQWPEEAKVSRSQFVIVNDDHQGVIDQVLETHRAILEQAG